jgi:hypothetical protein
MIEDTGDEEATVFMVKGVRRFFVIRDALLLDFR